MAQKYFVQPTDSIIVTYAYCRALSSVNYNTPYAEVTLAGVKLNGDFLDTLPLIQTSKLVPLLNGGTLPIVNKNKAGKLTLNTVRTTASVEDGYCDIMAVANAQRNLGDTMGATITVKWVYNGKDYKIGFYHCIPAEVTPVKLSGNDCAVYAQSFNYTSWAWLQR